MAKVADIVKIADVENIILPMACRTVASDFLIPNLEEYVKEVMRLSGVGEYASQVSCKNKYSFAFKNGRTYYISAIHFPFEETKEFSGCLRRAFVVFMNDRPELHYFGEIFYEDVARSCFGFKLRYYCYRQSQNDITSYDVLERTVENEKVMAEQLPAFVYGAVYHGVAGFLIPDAGMLVDNKESQEKLLLFKREELL